MHTYYLILNLLIIKMLFKTFLKIFTLYLLIFSMALLINSKSDDDFNYKSGTLCVLKK